MKENKVIITFKLNNWLLVLNYYSMEVRWIWVFWVQKANSTAFIAKIKEMPRSLFYDIPCYVTMGYKKWNTPLRWAQCEKLSAFETQSHVNYM